MTVGGCGTTSDSTDAVSDLEAQVSALEEELRTLTVSTTTIAPTTTSVTTTTTTSTASPATSTTTTTLSMGVAVHDYFPDLPVMGSDEYGDIPGLLALQGVMVFTGALSDSDRCHPVRESIIRLVGTYGEWALPLWFDAVNMWGADSVVGDFESCLDPNDPLRGWWGEEWDSAKSGH